MQMDADWALPPPAAAANQPPTLPRCSLQGGKVKAAKAPLAVANKGGKTIEETYQKVTQVRWLMAGRPGGLLPASLPPARCPLPPALPS